MTWPTEDPAPALLGLPGPVVTPAGVCVNTGMGVRGGDGGGRTGTDRALTVTGGGTGVGVCTTTVRVGIATGV